MVEKPSAGARECLQRAADCDSLADRTTDAAAKRSFIDVAERWRRLAESREYIDGVDRRLGKPRG